MRWWMGVAVLAFAGASVGIAAEDQVPQSYGYLLFAPAASVPSGAGEGSLRIVSCRVTEKGLEVRGNAAPGDPPIQIDVAPGDPAGAGVRVGVALAAHVPQWAGAVPGDFQVVIPWATRESRFAIVSGGQAASAAGLGEQGPSAACPLDES